MTAGAPIRTPRNDFGDVDAPHSMAGLMASPWALTVDVHNEIQAIYAAHAQGPKLDIKALEKILGFPLAVPRAGYQVDRGIAIIQIEGLIAPKANLLTRVCGATSAQLVTQDLKAAMADPAIKGIVLAIDSPGGSVNGSPELAAAVFEASSKKPVVAHSEALIQSAAYWIGSAANAVYISGPTVNTGSIGVVMSRRFAPDGGSNSTEIFAGRYKQYTSSVKRPTKDAVAYLQSQVDYIYQVFVDAVAAYRGIPSRVVAERMAEGRTFIGRQAVDVGLVDEIMPLRHLVSAMARNPSEFANRRRIGARRIAKPTGAHAAALYARSAVLTPAEPRVQTKAEQGAVAEAHAKANGIGIVQALKALGFAT